MSPESDVAPSVTRALECCLLGPMRLLLDGHELNVSFKKVLGLVAYLALEGPTSRSRLVGLLWSDLDEESARRNLRRELHRLKTKTPELHGRFEVEGEHLRLGQPWSSDVGSFERALEEDHLESALGLYRGPLLEGFEVDGAGGFNDWLVTRREHLEKAHRRAALSLAERCETRGDWRRALELHVSLLERDDLQERTHREIMRLHYLLGEREAALAQFEKCKVVLERELDLAPLPETVSLAERIRAAGTLERTIDQSVPSASLLLPARAPLVGRRDPWARMETAWAAGQLIFVSGEPGVGKTRLLLEFAASKGEYIQNAGRPGDIIAPYSTATRTIAELLERKPTTEMPAWVRRELSRLVPRLADEPPPPAGSSEERLRFFNAFAELVALVLHDVPTLVSDDLQFFDTASLEMGLYASQRFADGGRRVMAAFRRGELRPETDAMIEQFVSSGQGILIELEPLDENGVLELVRGLSGSGGAALFSKRLHRATGGNPFFALETIRSLFEAELLKFDANGDWTTPFDALTTDYAELPIPVSVREAVLRRVKRLGSAPQRLLEAACLTADGFSLETLRGATALTEWEGLEALEAAIRARIFEPFGEGYHFAHDLMRSSLEEHLSLERKRLLHRKLAVSLEKLDGQAARIADHLEKAGQKLEAVAWRIKAAEAAQKVYANREALEQYAKALQDGAIPLVALSIREARAEALLILFDYPALEVELEGLEALAVLLGTTQTRVSSWLWQARVHNVLSRSEACLALTERLLALDGLSPNQLARARWERANAFHKTAKLPEARELAERALADLPESELRLRAQFHKILSVVAVYKNDYAQAIEQARNGVNLERQREALGQPQALRNLAEALSTLAIVHGQMGQLEEATALLEPALEMARKVGAINLQQRLLINLALASGGGERELAYLQASLRLAEINSDPELRVMILHNIGANRAGAHRYGAALTGYQEAFEIAKRANLPHESVVTALHAAQLRLGFHDLNGAAPYIEWGRNRIEGGGHDQHAFSLECLCAQCDLLEDRPESVLTRLKDLPKPDEATPDNVGLVQYLRAQAHLMLGQPDRALERIVDPMASPLFHRRIAATRLEARIASGTLEREDIRQADELVSRAVQGSLEALELRRALVRALEAVGEPERALETRRTAGEDLLEIAATLEEHSALRATLLEKNRDLFNAG